MSKPKKVSITFKQLLVSFDEGAKAELWRELVAKHGNEIQLTLGPIPTGLVLIADGYLVRLAQEQKMPRGPVMTRVLRDFMGDGSVLGRSPGPEHLRLRRAVLPPFAAKALDTYIENVTRAMDDALASWKDKPQINVREATTKLAREIVLNTFFRSTPLSEEEQLVFVRLLELSSQNIMARAALPKALYGLVPGNSEYQKTKRQAHGIVARIIKARREAVDPGDDIVALLLSEFSQAGLSDEEIKDNLVSLFIAGYETTAAALGWSLYCLATNPQVVDGLYDELTSINRPLDYRAILKEFPGIARFRQEVLRLYGASWQGFGWTTSRGFTVGEYQLPPLHMVFLLTHFAHRERAVWGEDAEAFRPDRFLEDYPERAYVPFGAGERTCVGEQLEKMLLTIFVIRTLNRYTVSVNWPQSPVYHGTLGVPHTMTATIS